jgi:DNA-binding NarL/FixJ family response regulator
VNEERRCLIIDEHPILRLGVRGVLGDRFQVEEAAHGSDALELLTALGGFDVAIVELVARGEADRLRGIAAIRALRKASPGLPIVAHGPRAEAQAATEAIEAGAAAFVAKSSPPDSLSRAVDAAVAAESFVDPAAGGNGGGVPLTKRQRQILQLYADGHSTAAVSARLGLSLETVRTHTKALLSRLHARDRAHAVALALRTGLIE